MAVSGYEKKNGLCGNLKSHKMGSKNSSSGKFERIYGLICVLILLKRDSRGKPHVCVCVLRARNRVVRRRSIRWPPRTIKDGQHPPPWTQSLAIVRSFARAALTEIDLVLN